MQWKEGLFFVFWVESKVLRSLYVLSRFSKKSVSLGSWNDGPTETRVSGPSQISFIRWNDLPPPLVHWRALGYSCQMHILCILPFAGVGRFFFSCCFLFWGVYYPSCIMSLCFWLGANLTRTHFLFPISSSFKPCVSHKGRHSCGKGNLTLATLFSPLFSL